MATKTLGTIAEEYFYSINPLAKRIGEDVAATKEAYEGLWETLSLKEQNQALDETIIQPEVALKYAIKKQDCSYYPKLRMQTGMKYLCDDTGVTLRWKDEHSAPFSFMTQSQMNLNNSDPPNETGFKNLNGCLRDDSHLMHDSYSSPSSQISYYQSENYSDTIFSTEDCSTTLSCLDDTSDGVFSNNKIVSKPSIMKARSNSDDGTENLLKELKNSKNFLKNAGDKSYLHISFQKSDNESTALLDTPSSFHSFQSLHASNDPEIPKTGFEFLDNW